MLILNVFFMLSYITGNNSFPQPLSADEERECILKLKNGSAEEKEQARNTLVERNLRLVAHIAKKYGNTPIPGDDLISVGTIGLMKGIASFDSDKGTKLATYVARCIENAILSLRRFRMLKMENVYLLRKGEAYFAA